MKGLFLPTENRIVSYGIVYENMSEQDNVYHLPDDFDFERYLYVPNQDGTFNHQGIVINPEFEQTL
jgi:hypothetical protein